MTDEYGPTIGEIGRLVLRIDHKLDTALATLAINMTEIAVLKADVLTLKEQRTSWAGWVVGSLGAAALAIFEFYLSRRP